MRSAKEVNWGPAIFLITYQILLLISLPFYLYYGTLQTSTIAVSAILLYMTGLSITAGYHRYFAHKTYKTNRFVEAVILFFASMAGQGSALRWGFDHRLHHAYVDTDRDPYSIQKGFWYAHFLWMLEKPQVIDSKVVPDLVKNPLVVFQDKYSPLLMLVTNAIACVAVGWLLDDYWGAFFLSLWVRLCLLHHFTWFINSLAHTWGDKPFSKEQSAVNNYVISLLTFGEGYHNYHHTFANDYRNGIRWFHFDPTKWLIWSLSKIGLAHGLKKMDAATINKRLVVEHKILLIDQLSKYWTDKKQELELQVDEISNRILNKISTFNALLESYRQAKKNSVQYAIIKELKEEIRDLQKSLKDDWREWKNLSRNILNNKSPAPA